MIKKNSLQDGAIKSIPIFYFWNSLFQIVFEIQLLGLNTPFLRHFYAIFYAIFNSKGETRS